MIFTYLPYRSAGEHFTKTNGLKRSKGSKPLKFKNPAALLSFRKTYFETNSNIYIGDTYSML